MHGVRAADGEPMRSLPARIVLQQGVPKGRLADAQAHRVQGQGPRRRCLAGRRHLDVGVPRDVLAVHQRVQHVEKFGEEGKPKKGEPKMRSDADGPQENIHGDAPFVIKIQVPAPGTIRPPIMIYDRRRSVEFFLRIEVDRKGYEALEANARRTGTLDRRSTGMRSGRGIRSFRSALIGSRLRRRSSGRERELEERKADAVSSPRLFAYKR